MPSTPRRVRLDGGWNWSWRRSRPRLRNIEDAIVQGVAGKTTAALLHDREARRDALQARVRGLAHGQVFKPVQVGPREIRARLEQLHELLKEDSRS